MKREPTKAYHHYMNDKTVNYFNTGLHFYLKEDKPVVLFLTRSMVLVGTQDGGGHPVMMAPKSPCSST